MAAEKSERATEVPWRRTIDMIDHPRLKNPESDEAAIAVTLDPSSSPGFIEPSRETFPLSTRAIGLIVDELDYSEREEIAPVTVRTLFLTGGVSVPDPDRDPIDLLQRIRFPDGGKHPTDDEIERVAGYLKNAEIEQRIRWLVEELVEDSRLSTVMGPEEVRTQRERMNDLRGIAKDL